MTTSPYTNVNLDDPIMGEPVTVDGVSYRVLLVKVLHGAPGDVDGDASYSTPLPVTGSGGGMINRGSLTDASGTITTGGASQSVLAANTARAYMFFQNTSANTMWMNFGTAATNSEPSIRILAGTTFIFDKSFVDTDQVYVWGTTTADTFILKYCNITSTIINQGPLTDGSGTITAGGTSQELFAANPLRAYFLLQNLDSTHNLYINFGTAAVVGSPSITVAPGVLFLMDNTFICNQQINIIGGTTSQAFSAKVG